MALGLAYFAGCGLAPIAWTCGHSGFDVCNEDATGAAPLSITPPPSARHPNPNPDPNTNPNPNPNPPRALPLPLPQSVSLTLTLTLTLVVPFM